MSDIRLMFIVLNMLELLVFCICGHVLSKTRTNGEYWRKALVPILAYAVVTGLRFGREIDWNVYYYRYIGMGKDINFPDSAGLVFRYICNILYNIGIPYHIFIMLQCIFLIYTILLLVKNYKKQAAFILPTILTLIALNDNFIRWYVAVSFFLLSINYMINNKKRAMIIWFVVSFLSHYGIILFLPLLIFENWVNKLTFNKYILVALLFASCFILKMSQLSFISSIADMIVGTGGDMGTASSYLNSTDALINGERGNLGIEDRGIKDLLHFLAAAPIIFFAQGYVKRYHYGLFFFNLFAIGAITFPLFTSIEILGRYSQALYLFAMIVGGILFYEIRKQGVKSSLIALTFCFISFSFLIAQNAYNTFTYSNEYRMLFMWDANGQETVPTWLLKHE